MTTKIKERPIIFNAQEVNAVLAGGKTQVRAPVLTSEQAEEGFEWDFGADGDSAIFIKKIDDERQEVLLKPCPFGAIGDRLWVKEFHARTENENLLTRVHYYADGNLRVDLRHDAGLLTKYSADDMPRWASRILLEITDIRIERVRDISETDAIAMGVKRLDGTGRNLYTARIGCLQCSRPTAKEVYSNMVFSKYDEDIWDRNDWVWVVEFKVIEGTDL